MVERRRQEPKPQPPKRDRQPTVVPAEKPGRVIISRAPEIAITPMSPEEEARLNAETVDADLAGTQRMAEGRLIVTLPGSKPVAETQPEKSFSGPMPLPDRPIAALKDGAPSSVKPIDPDSTIGKQLSEFSAQAARFDHVQQHGTPDTPRNPVTHRREP